jgi:hypothetical protein
MNASRPSHMIIKNAVGAPVLEILWSLHVYSPVEMASTENNNTNK